MKEKIPTSLKMLSTKTKHQETIAPASFQQGRRCYLLIQEQYANYLTQPKPVLAHALQLILQSADLGVL